MALTMFLSVLLRIAFSFFLITTSRFDIVLLILRNNDKLSLSSSEETYNQKPLSTFPESYPTNSHSCSDCRFTTTIRFSLSPKIQNPFTVSTSSHNFSIESTFPSIIPLHLQQTKRVVNLEVTSLFLHIYHEPSFHISCTTLS